MNPMRLLLQFQTSLPKVFKKRVFMQKPILVEQWPSIFKNATFVCSREWFLWHMRIRVSHMRSRVSDSEKKLQREKNVNLDRCCCKNHTLVESMNTNPYCNCKLCAFVQTA
ncbi:hypothetical protein GUJ93_ZPchr0004g39325 [Zizania palustris]|uniref:Uncharacterized protein n=1 Tax=Zizania palustris TaxID=103762 RepID=A0A8J5RW67_ZIZPA|nr:hypothetical protein GUJ93_ZPchr0004g39325 [Zizania palustris]